MKHLLILTGPQGSGNHLFSKVFAESPFAFGWHELKNKYWVAHEQEPFAEAWNDSSKLADVDWKRFSYAATSISCPYVYKGRNIVPNYRNFISAATDLGYLIEVAIIGRDRNILKYQQERVRHDYTTPNFEKELEYLCSFSPTFLSTELLYLYKMNYVKNLQRQLKFPVHIKQEKLNYILENDPNCKYFNQAPDQNLDQIVRDVSYKKSNYE